jgi:hypothetical protein
MNQSRKQLISYFDNMSLFLIGLSLFLFPLFFLSITTDAFVLPKELILIAGTTLALVFLGLKTIFEGKLAFKSSPFDLPVSILLIVTLISAVLSINRYDSLAAFVPFLFAIILYFTIINVVKTQKHLLFILASLTAGAVASGILAILSFFKIYALDFHYTNVALF